MNQRDETKMLNNFQIKSNKHLLVIKNNQKKIDIVIYFVIVCAILHKIKRTICIAIVSLYFRLLEKYSGYIT